MTTEQKRRRRPRWRLPVFSVRTRLLTVIALAAAIGLLGVGLTVYVTERQRILATTDDLLRNNLESAQVLIEQHTEEQPDSTAEEALRVIVQRVSPDDNMGVLGVVDGTASLVPGVPLDLSLESRPDFVSHVVSAADRRGGHLGRYATDDVAWAYFATPVLLSGLQDEDVLFVMAYDLQAELGEINAAGRAYLVASAAMLVFIVAIGGAVAGRLLRPLRQMRETAERVSGQALDERLPIVGRDDVSELARTMNDMLDRIDASLGAQRKLVSDVRHELRTPITIVRGHLELMDPAHPDDVADTRELTMDELDRMSSLVQDLSEMAALEGRPELRPEPTDVGDLIDQIVRKARAIDGAAVSRRSSVTLVADVDPGRITQAMLQLVQNAVTHGGGQIEIGSRVTSDALELWVRDHGPGVPEDAKQKVFDRFFRGSESTSGSGLGLHIVGAIAGAHGGTARVHDASGGGAVFVLSIPLSPAVASAAVSAPDVPDPGTIPPRPPLPGPGGLRRAPDAYGDKEKADGIDSDR